MIRALLFTLLLAAPLPVRGQEIAPQRVQAEELAQVRDRLMTSLFFRGELADMMIAAGEADKFVDLDGVESNSEARSLLLGWIKRNPGEAAEVYLHLRGGGRSAGQTQVYRTAYEINANFLALIKSLNAAAGDKGVPAEALELAARRLYEGPQAAAETEAVSGGKSGGGGSSFFPGEYADYRLNKAGLGRELAAAGAWLDALRGPAGRGPAGLEKYFGRALAEYGAFVAAAASVKGREAITAEESRLLEARRAYLRGLLTALALRSRAADLAAAAAGISPAEPGSAKLLKDLLAAAAALEAAAARIEAGELPLAELGGLARSSEKEFSALYLRVTAYNGLLSLKRRAGSGAFTCLHDYLFYRYLAAFFPASPYVKARSGLEAAAASFGPALEAAGSGDLGAALSLAGDKAGAVPEAEALVRRAGRLNRAAQFLQWGLLFRPVEYKVSPAGNRPVFAFADIFGFGE